MTPSIPNDNLVFPAKWRALSAPMLAAGFICVLISVGLFYFMLGGEDKSLKPFFQSYLANYMFCLSICLGALFFVMVQHLVRASWSASIRRFAELLAITIPLWALLFLPIVGSVLFGSTAVYSWNTSVEELKINEPVVAEKVGYLNITGFSIRSIVYFAVFIALALFYFRMSRKQDETGDTGITLKLQKYAGPGIMLFALAVNFAAFDWMMSTDPAWFSTMYGVYLFAASMLSFFATMILACFLLQKNGRMEKVVNVEHFHDMGKFQFGFVVFWGYIAFSQFLLYWYGNIPEETLWYKHRMEHGWEYLGLVLILFHFALPFLGTMSRHVRRNRGVMAAWAAFILVVHWLDMTFLIMPNVGDATVGLYVSHALCWIGMVSIFLGLFVWRVGDTPIVATKDPWLPEALAYHNI